MSELIFQREANGRHHARSAGTQPIAQVHPIVADAMREIGLDVGGRRPQKLTRDLAQWADVVVTMGCGDECPFIPGKRYIDWELEDPSGKSLDAVRRLRDEISARVTGLLKELG
jgi:arsenate reductase